MSENTKDLILHEALTLFAQKGYTETSVRDISDAAGVNVASINYHFGSKHDLFQAVIVENMTLLDQVLLEALGDKDLCLADAIWIFYTCLLGNQNAFLSIFRLFLSGSVNFPDSPISVGKVIGPPGANHLLRVLEREVPGLCQEAYIWAVHILSTHLFHVVLMQVSPFGQQKLQNLYFCQEDYKKKSFEIFTYAVVAKLRDGSIDWTPLSPNI